MFRLAAKLLVSTIVMCSCLVFADFKPIQFGRMARLDRAKEFCNPKDFTIDLLCVDKISKKANPIERKGENKRGYIELEYGSSLGVEIDGFIFQYSCGSDTGVVRSTDNLFRLTYLRPEGRVIPVHVVELCSPNANGEYQPLEFVCSTSIKDSITLADTKSAIIFSRNSKIALNYLTGKAMAQCDGQASQIDKAEQKPVPKAKKKPGRMKGKQEKEVKGSRED